jgi:hypothetical protein
MDLGRRAGGAAMLTAMMILSAATCFGADGGFLNRLGGLFNRGETQTNNAATNSTAERIRALEDLVLNPSTNNASTNASSLADRLGAFLGRQSEEGTNAPAATNLVQKVRDYFQALQSNGTNSTSTNSTTQRAWMSLTNWIATHSSTNSTGSSGLSGTNLMQKLRDWVAAEQLSHSQETNTASSALNILTGLLNGTNNASTNSLNTSETNASPANPFLKGVGNLLNRNADSGSNTNSEPLRERFRRR